VPAAWVTKSTIDHVPDPQHDHGYLWWIDRADGYAYMAGLYGQLADDLDALVVHPRHRARALRGLVSGGRLGGGQ
jgi:hypothetical protein